MNRYVKIEYGRMTQRILENNNDFQVTINAELKKLVQNVMEEIEIRVNFDEKFALSVEKNIDDIHDISFATSKRVLKNAMKTFFATKDEEE
jgi:hypothetical protein